MKILFLDDDEGRHELFAEASVGHDVRHVRTAAEAIKALEQHGPFDVASLDHDLGELQMVEPGTTGHGLDVARYIAAEAREGRRPARAVVVHSYNPAGAQAMLAELRGTGIPNLRAPFMSWKPGPA